MLQGGSTRTSIFGGGFSKLGIFFAPDIPSVRGSVKLSSKKFAKEILDHELFSGIIPAKANLPWAKAYQIKTKGGKKYALMQRLANFEYVKQHYASRTASVSGTFNPYFLPGFPSLIIDKHLSEAQLNTYQSPIGEAEFGIVNKLIDIKDKRDLLATLVAPQYLGFCQQLTHTLNQQGGITSYNFTMVRTHRETTDKLGISTTETYTRYRTTTRTSHALLPKIDGRKMFRTGPYGQKMSILHLTNRQDILPSYYMCSQQNVCLHQTHLFPVPIFEVKINL